MTATQQLDTTAAPASSRAEVIARLRAHEAEIRGYGATALYLFGSATRDEMREDSDVDVFIDYERDGSLDYYGFCRIEDLLAVCLSRRVDLTTRQGLHPLSRTSIEQSSVRIF